MNDITKQFRGISSFLTYFPAMDGIRFVPIFLVFLFRLTSDSLRHSPSSYRDVHASQMLFAATQVAS